MQLYGRGLRRRLPSMLGGDERRMKMAYSLAFSLPGTPVLFYGEEIGMAENLDIPGRLAVRSPMQWTGGVNGGFSTAAKQRLTRPLTEGLYGRTGSTPPTNATTTGRSGGSSATSSTPTASSQKSAGRKSRCSNSPTRRCWPTCVARSPAGRWSHCTTSAADACMAPIELEDVPAGSKLVDLLHGLAEHNLDGGPGRHRPRALRLPVAARAATGGRSDHLTR